MPPSIFEVNAATAHAIEDKRQLRSSHLDPQFSAKSPLFQCPGETNLCHMETYWKRLGKWAALEVNCERFGDESCIAVSGRTFSGP